MQLTSWAVASLLTLSGGLGWFVRGDVPSDRGGVGGERRRVSTFWTFERDGAELRAALVGPWTERGLQVAVLLHDSGGHPVRLLTGTTWVQPDSAHPYEVALGGRSIGVEPAPGLLWADVGSREQVVLTVRDAGEAR